MMLETIKRVVAFSAMYLATVTIILLAVPVVAGLLIIYTGRGFWYATKAEADQGVEQDPISSLRSQRRTAEAEKEILH